MTRNEVMALTDDELQREVAKAQGYDVDHVPDGAPSGYYIPDYLYDIETAWPLLDEIQSVGGDVEINIVRYHDRTGYIEIYNRRHERLFYGEFGPSEYVASGPATFEKAISRAYLIAKGVSV